MSLKKIALWWRARKRRTSAPEGQAPQRAPRFTLTKHVVEESMPGRGIGLDEIKRVLLAPDVVANTVNGKGEPTVRLERRMGDRTLKVWVDGWPEQDGHPVTVITAAWRYQEAVGYPRGIVDRLMTRNSRARVKEAGGKHARMTVHRTDGQIVLEANERPGVLAMARVVEDIADEHYLWLVENDHSKARGEA